MDQQTFSSLFRDLISRIYDRVAIENHPLTTHFSIAPDAKMRRAEAIRQLILHEIENLRPDGNEVLWQSQEWRPYLILSKRYIEGEDPSEIAKALYIGDRQFRRDHSRALLALSARIWDLYIPHTSEPEDPDKQESDEQLGFEFHPESLDLREIVEGVVSLTTRRFQSEQVELRTELPAFLPNLITDRVALRQILLSLLNYVAHLRASPVITLQVETVKNDPDAALQIKLSFEADDQWAGIQNDEEDTLEFVRKLSKNLPAQMKEIYPAVGTAGPAEIQLSFGPGKPKMILMVDDQPATIKLFQRYLSGKTLEITGLNDPALAVETARQLQPALILLDVMMPRIDGWEVLQNLQLDPRTRHIPIIVCSAWGESELAHSLGAIEFLKKPVIQKELLSAFNRLGIIQD